MKTALFSAMAFGACASVALAEPFPPAGGANDGATTDARPAGAIALAEAEMDKITGGVTPADMFMKVDGINGESRALDGRVAWSWGLASQ